ncbi:hypothetical protein R3P38DRAFT_1036667 [Favolaschia claudopus]|uniref:Uncharacterized protein n=1 Tax=Favolaschia claudopus TaxID=2862362 RepID=A0AAW0BJK5_9AGAR
MYHPYFPTFPLAQYLRHSGVLLQACSLWTMLRYANNESSRSSSASPLNRHQFTNHHRWSSHSQKSPSPAHTPFRWRHWHWPGLNAGAGLTSYDVSNPWMDAAAGVEGGEVHKRGERIGWLLYSLDGEEVGRLFRLASTTSESIRSSGYTACPPNEYAIWFYRRECSDSLRQTPRSTAAGEWYAHAAYPHTRRRCGTRTMSQLLRAWGAECGYRRRAEGVHQTRIATLFLVFLGVRICSSPAPPPSATGFLHIGLAARFGLTTNRCKCPSSLPRSRGP